MTRAKDISKILTDADLSGTLDVAGTVTAGGLSVEGSTAPTINIKSTDAVVVADDVVGAITFEESDATGGTGVQAFVKAIANDSGNTYDMSIGVGGNTEAIRIDQSGNVGIGTSSPDEKLDVRGSLQVGIDGTAAGLIRLMDSGSVTEEATISTDANGGLIFGGNSGAGELIFKTSSGTERVRITSGGNVGIGTASPSTKLEINGGTDNNIVRIVSTDANANIEFADNTTTSGLQIGANGDNMKFGISGAEAMRIDSSGDIFIGTSSDIAPANGTNLYISDGTISRIGLEKTGSNARKFSINNGGTYFSVYDETADAERMRIDSSGNLLVGITTNPASQSGTTTGGQAFIANSYSAFSRVGGVTAYFNRQYSDGDVIAIRQDGSDEGFISVSGTTVTYGGGHLARWSRLLDNSKDTTIVKGTVMINLNEMVEWSHDEVLWTDEDELPDGVSVGDVKKSAYTEDNEQLNKMAVSSVEGDANVAGVFVSWHNDDDGFNDMIVAMTGDMVIRIAQGTTVARGDLLMSAGDGTAKPQGDDIVRSKTIAKVTSTNVSHTYDDGTYLVPCVLMAC